MNGLRVLVASTKSGDSNKIINYLKQLGCIIIGKAMNQGVALRLISVSQPDLVIVDNHSIFSEVVTVLTEDKPSPLIIIAEPGYAKKSPRSVNLLNCGYLERPFGKELLSLMIRIELERFQRLSEVREVYNTLNKPNSTRKLVAKASAVIARKSGLDEMQALCQLQVMSFERRQPLRDVAQEIILAASNE